MLAICVAAWLTSLSASWGQSKTSPYPRMNNLALHKTVTLDTPPNYPEVSDAADATQLTDGRLAAKTPLWYDKQAVGWVGAHPAQFTIDLGKVQPIRGVALHTAAGQAGVEWPASVQIYVSDTGEQFSPAGDLMKLLTHQPPARGYAAAWLMTEKLKTHGRYVKFICTPGDKGNGAYVFLDEVQIDRGEDAWLNQPLSTVKSPNQWQADWTKIKWQDQPSAIPEAQRPAHLRVVDGSTVSGEDQPLQQVTAKSDGVRFTLKGEAGKSRAMTWIGELSEPVSTENCRFVVLTFQAGGIQRAYDQRPLVELLGVNNQAGKSSATLMEVNLPMNDGRSHTLVMELPKGLTVNQIKISLPTQDDTAHLTLQRLELLHEAPQVFNDEIKSDAAPASGGMEPLKLGDALNGTLADWYQHELSEHKIVLDGARLLKAGPVTVSGVPFIIADGDKNLAKMPESHPTTERVEFLGAMVDKQFLEPQSRDDALSISVDAQAREAFLLLALSSPPIQKWGGQESAPLRLDDIESFSVQLTYDHGPDEVAFPYSLADQASYIPARELGAYAVAVDSTRRLKKITLHNHHYGPNFALVGLTLNTSDKAVVPMLAKVAPPQRTRENPQPETQPLSVAHQEQRLIFKNRWYDCEFNLAQGFVLDKFANRWNASAPIHMGDNAGLRVRIGDTIYTGRCFKVRVVKTTDTQARLKLTSTCAELPLEIDLIIAADDSPQLTFTAQAFNRGKKALDVELCLPALADVSIGDVAQTRVFFPQYRAVDTGETIALRAPYGPEFTQQFMDIYSRTAGVGLMVRTHNDEQRMADFTLRKDDGGVSGGVCFPAEYNQLAAGASRQYIPVSLVAHNGDWRDASSLQRDWVRTWYKPFRSQDKDYLLNGWEIACYRPSSQISWSDTRTPPNINAERTKWMTDEIFAFEKKHHGHVPDMVHFFNWTHNDKTGQNEYGIFGTTLAYAQVGGLDFFRKGIAHIQDDWHVPVSLYTLIDRFRASALPDQALAKKLAARAPYKELDTNDSTKGLRASDQPDGIYYIHPGDPDWLNFELDDIVKMQRDTGCKMVYIDVFSTWSNAMKSYPGSSPRLADLIVLKTLKKKLPPDVAIWSEYSPTDYATQWEDGSLQYYFLHLNEVFARRYDYADKSHDLYREMPLSIARFILPHFKTIGLPAYIEASNNPSQVDAIFVNGGAIQEDTWRLHHSRIREKLDRAYDVKHQYNDCFNSDHPSPHVDTAVEGIVANLFPGRNRNLWTLYNGRAATFSGIVLAIPHHPGATYRDAWNGKELSAVIEDGIAKISLTIDPQQPGCVVQDWNKPE
jgi:hypothetical protein